MFHIKLEGIFCMKETIFMFVKFCFFEGNFRDSQNPNPQNHSSANESCNELDDSWVQDSDPTTLRSKLLRTFDAYISCL